MALKPEHIQNFQKPEEPPKQSETFQTPSPAMDISAPEPEKNLFVVHETKPHCIQHFEDNHEGFIPGPSLAVAHRDRGVVDAFGEIKLLAHPSLVDPTKPDVHVFNTDASTPTGSGHKWVGGDVEKLTKAFNWTPQEGENSHHLESFDPNFIHHWDREDGYYSPILKAFRKDFGDHLAGDKHKEHHHLRQWVKKQFKDSGYRKQTATEEVEKQKLRPLVGGELGDEATERPDIYYDIRKIKSLEDIKNETENLSGRIKSSHRVTPMLHGLPAGVDHRAKLKIMGEYNHGKYKTIEDAIDANVGILEPKEKAGFADGIRETIESQKISPSRYLEAKILRPVHLSEFHTALVPHNTSSETVKTLQKHGLNVRSYSNESPIDQVLSKELEQNNLLLSEKTAFIWPTHLKKHQYHNDIASNPNFHNSDAHSPETFLKDSTPLTPEHAKHKETFEKHHTDIKTVLGNDKLLAIGVNQKVIHKIGKDKYMVKPYASGEGLSQRVFHAAGLGHLHQQSFATNYSEDGSPAPANVIRINPGYKTLQHHSDIQHVFGRAVPSNQGTRRDFLKIKLLDHVLGAKDRHSDNIMLHKDTGAPLAIDNDGIGKDYILPSYHELLNNMRRAAKSLYGDNSLRDSYEDTHHVTHEWWPTVRNNVLEVSRGHLNPDVSSVGRTIEQNIQGIDRHIELDKTLDEDKMPHVVFHQDEEKIAKADDIGKLVDKSRLKDRSVISPPSEKGSLPYKAALHPEKSLQYSYNHILPKELIEKGYALEVEKRSPASWKSQLSFRGEEVGNVDGYVGGKEHSSIEPHSSLNTVHRGKGLGQKMYEALFTHVREHHGITKVMGGVHSEDAERVHRALAAKHGFTIEGSIYNSDGGNYQYGDYEYDLGRAPERYKQPNNYQKLQIHQPHPKDVRITNDKGEAHNTSGPSTILHHRDGRIKKVLYYENGRPHRTDGPAALHFFENGSLKTQEHAKNGKISHRTVYYEGGQIRSKLSPLEEMVYRSDGSKKEHNTFNSEGKNTSSTYFHGNGVASEKTINDFKNNNREVHQFSDDGTLAVKSIINTNTGYLSVHHYHKNGNIGATMHYDGTNQRHHDTEPAVQVFADDGTPVTKEYFNHGNRIPDPTINKHEGHDVMRGVSNIHSFKQSITDDGTLEQDLPLPTPEHHALKNEFDANHHDRKTLKTFKLPIGSTDERHIFNPYAGANAKVIHQINGNKYMVKPFTQNEGLSQRVFHAAGVGHLHQRSFTTSYTSDINPEKNYATVVHINKDYQELAQARQKNSKVLKSVDLLDLGKVAIMDYALGQSDRHGNNIMIHKKTGKPLAIDNDGLGAKMSLDAHTDLPLAMYLPYQRDAYQSPKDVKRPILKHLMKNWWPTVKDSVLASVGDHPFKNNIHSNFAKLDNFNEEKMEKHEGHDFLGRSKNYHHTEYQPSDLESDLIPHTPEHAQFKKEFDENHKNEDTIKSKRVIRNDGVGYELKLLGGVNPKMVHRINGSLYMVKPYTNKEGLSQRVFHAAGLGHLHQKSFTSHYSEDGHTNPATVIKMDGNYNTLQDSTGTAKNHDDWARLGILDFALGQGDRHQNNVMVHRETGMPLAIDNEALKKNPVGLTHDGYPLHPQDVPSHIRQSACFYHMHFYEDGIPNRQTKLTDSIQSNLKHWWPTVRDQVIDSLGNHPLKDTIHKNVEKLDASSKTINEDTPPPVRPSNPHNAPGASTESIQKSEVDVMLSNPNHVERLLAVKLDSFKRKNVPTALFDDSPSVWQEILRHDAFKKYATKILVSCPTDSHGYDLWPKQEYAVKNNLLDSKELDILYSTILHTDMDDHSQKARLKVVSEAKSKLNAA